MSSFGPRRGAGARWMLKTFACILR